MKKNKINILALSLFFMGSFLFTSCNDDDYTDDSVIALNRTAHVAAVDPFLNVDGTSSFNEGGIDREIKFAVVMAEPQPVGIYVTVESVSGGTAEEGVDYDFDHQVFIPAWSSRGEGTVTIYGDSEIETTESFSISVGVENDANIDLVGKILSFNITDFGDLTIGFDWNQPIPGYPFTLCDIGYDVDIFVYDSNGDDVSGFQAATGACPEEMTLSLADLADGEYTIMQNLYDDAGLAAAGITPAFAIPVTVNYSRANSTFAGSFVQDATDAIDSDFGNVVGYDTQFMYVATLTIENGIFTFSKNGSTIASGRMAASKFKKPNKVKRVRVI